jgi:putative ABC transport system ATP-binding protein
LKHPHQAIVSLQHVRKQYGSGDNVVAALQDVTVDFMRGTFTAIMGPSGSGKSTLLQCAAGLDQPSTGKTMVDGTDIGRLSEAQRTLLRRDTIGFIFQSFNLVSALTAEENATLPLRLAGKKPVDSEVTAMLEAVGLGGRTHHRPAQLSGGQQQRVAIARALISKPAVLFADEPTGALDSTMSKEVLKLLREIVDKHEQTIIMVTHDPVAASYADSVIFLADGQIITTIQRSEPAVIAAKMAGLERAAS